MKQATLDTLIADPYFKERVKFNLDKLIGIRKLRREPKPGFRYRRDWHDRMNEENKLTVDFFLENIKSIWQKESNLSSEIRRIIRIVCDMATIETTHYYNKLEKNTTHENGIT